ncbi:MAG: nucleoside-triphosphatase [Candidatus Marinimicrobia bacterium]|nr:nucleoside-triphosphatase [Candidatus Neomarinimicrobiota bacterium]
MRSPFPLLPKCRLSNTIKSQNIYGEPVLNIITGKINSGKTAYMRSLYEKSPYGDGVLSVKHYNAESFCGYDLHHLKSGKEMAFIRLIEKLPAGWDSCAGMEKFSFSGQGLQFAERIFRSINEGPVYIDEIGPLEIIKKKGFYPILQELLKSKKNIYLTVREEMINNFISAFSIREQITVTTIQ